MVVQAFLESIRTISPHAEPIVILSMTAVLGLLLGSLQFRGLKLGVAGMLFSGLLLGHFGITLDPHLLAFLKEFGLALFVFTVGLQLGPGFFNSLKKDGMKLNSLAALIILLGGLIAFGFGSIIGWQPGVLSGLFSGATTNTPSLGAAQQAYATTAASGAGQGNLAAVSYAVAYPFGVIGIILAIVLLRWFFKINIADELKELQAMKASDYPELKRQAFRVENASLVGQPLRELPGLSRDGVVISRIRHQAESHALVARPESCLQLGDVVLAVGTPEALQRAGLSIGPAVEEDLRKAPSDVISKRVIVTDRSAVGKTLAQIEITERLGVVVSRVSRQDLVLSAMPNLKLQFGDMLHIVGEPSAIDDAAKLLGNSVRQLNETSFASIFIGILIGVFFGLYPWHIPGLPVPLRLGLAGGPLIIAILMGRMGRIGPLVIHMPINANTAFRELGIIFFLACVGLGAGGKFVETAFSPLGVQWMLLGAMVTMIPLLVVGGIARKVLKLNFITISGLFAGSMTDPPALAFANKLTQSDYPALSYANVYPLTMLLRILTAQVAVLLLMA
ncbi:MAG: putative transporter [Verrucomicrobia bacterium]|nr:MAG: putative transporter [Verrucomicrobiota bacterium]